MITTRNEFRQSLDSIQTQVIQLNDAMANLDPRVTDCESRIAKIEDNMDDRFRDQEQALKALTSTAEE